MSLKYNLVSIPESGIRKVDQNGAALGGAQFQLFPADAQYQPIGDAVYEGTTDPNGELVFTNERGFPITLEQLDAQYDYMVLREVGAPAGYRHPGDMHLRFENGVLLSTNEWDTGAWSQAKLTATATDPIRIDNGDGTVGVVDPSGGTMFAVIMKRHSMSAPVDDPANWAPVSGDALAGWQVGADNSLASIVQAVRATPYPFALGTNGAYQVEVDNLPGDVNQYYGMLANNGEDTSGAQYTVQYYYVAGSGGADGASARTIHRILTEPDAGYAGFSYAYSVRLYIANIRNGFLVAKTDTAGNPLAGATFALYRRADMVDVTDSDTSDTTGGGMDRARARWQWDRDPGRGAWRLAGGRGDDRRRRRAGVPDRRPYARPGRLRTCGDRRAGRVRSERAGGAGCGERSGRIRRCGRSRRRGARGPWRRIPGAQHGAVRGGTTTSTRRCTT